MDEEQNQGTEIKNQGTENLGMFARHPIRTMGGAFLAGAAIGMGTAAGKHRHNRSALRRMLDG